MVVIIAFILIAIFADQLAPYDYAAQDLPSMYLSPCAEHPLGTDNLGRDMLSRIIYGTRISLLIGFSSVGISLLIGTLLGCLAGFYGVLLAIVIAAVLGTGVFNLILAIGIASIPSYARIVRASILSIRDQEYIEAARISGCSDARMILRHILPNILAPVIVQTTLGLGLAILNASGLSFLGLGVEAPMPEWGSMLAEAQTYLRTYPNSVIWPGVVISLITVALSLIGNGLSEALEPQIKE